MGEEREWARGWFEERPKREMAERHKRENVRGISPENEGIWGCAAEPQML